NPSAYSTCSHWSGQSPDETAPPPATTAYGWNAAADWTQAASNRPPDTRPPSHRPACHKYCESTATETGPSLPALPAAHPAALALHPAPTPAVYAANNPDCTPETTAPHTADRNCRPVNPGES